MKFFYLVFFTIFFPMYLFSQQDLQKKIEQFFSLGSASQIHEAYQQAIANFDKVLQLDPKFVKAYLHRGQCHKQLENYQKAIDDLYRLENSKKNFQKEMAVEKYKKIPFKKDTLLITNSGTNEILAYDLEGKFLSSITATTIDTEWTVGVSIGPDNALYLSSYAHGAILRFSPQKSSSMKWLGLFTYGGDLHSPEGFLFHKDALYVASSGTNAILKYKADSGKFMQTIAKVDSPWSITADSLGNIYFDSEDNKIYKFDGKNTAVFASDHFLQRPAGLVFDKNYLYVGSQDTNSVLKFNAKSGKFIGIFCIGKELQSPWQCVFGPDNHLYVASSSNNAILKYHGKTGKLIKVLIQDEKVAFPNGLFFVR